jgi:hypothetical protein
MPSLKALGTSLVLRARWILSIAAILLCVCALEAPSSAQAKPKHGRHKAAGAKAGGKAAKADASGAAKPNAAAQPPAKAPKITASPHAPSVPKPTPSSTAALWKRVVGELEDEYVTRRPERGFELALGKPQELLLGTFGASATVRWREALADGLAGLGRIENERRTAASDAELRRLADWIQLELLLLDGTAPSIQSPSSYVRRAADTLRAASEALWIAPEDRQRVLARLMAELPAYFRDARISLVSPVPEEIELALRELVDLRERVDASIATLPEPAPNALGAAKAPAPFVRPVEVRGALEAFRAWLLEERESAGGLTPRLDADEWTKLLRLATGSAWDPCELKARALRELARLDLAQESEHREHGRVPDPQGLPLRLGSAAVQAVRVGCTAHCLRDTLDPRGVEFALEPSARSSLATVWLRAGSAEAARAYVELPNASWSPSRTATRCEGLRKEQVAALGVRYGMAGEGLFATLARTASAAPAMLRDNRLVREGLGLYALDWMSRVDWVENPFRGNAEIEREFARQRGYEAARLVAALELHAEGLSLREEALAFQRRTGVDDDTAFAETLAAERDPLHGIGYLGLLELLALEQRVAEHVEPRKALRVTLQLVARNPELRPRDLAWERALTAPAEAGEEEKAESTLEKTGPAQQEHPRSR